MSWRCRSLSILSSIFLVTGCQGVMGSESGGSGLEYRVRADGGVDEADANVGNNDAHINIDAASECEPGEIYMMSCASTVAHAAEASGMFRCQDDGQGFALDSCELVACEAGFEKMGERCVEQKNSSCEPGATDNVDCVLSDRQIDDAWVPTNDIRKQPIDPTSYLKKYTLPDCQGDDAMIIDSKDDWKQINTSNKRIFCVKPGDYRRAGRVTLTASGSSERPRVIRLLSNDVALNTHLAAIAPQDFKMDLSDSQRASNARILSNKLALIPAITFKGGKHWVIDRMTFFYVGSHPIQYLEDSGSHDNIINGVRIENEKDGVYHQSGNHRNTFQNGFIYRSGVGENVCIGFQGWYKRDTQRVNVHDTQIINNELRDCGDGIQTTVHKLKHNFAGTKIISNNIYLTTDKYADCGSGRRTRSGECACAENAIDIKAASNDASKPMLIKGNIISGWRKAVKKCDGRDTHHSDWGGGLVVHLRTDNIVIEDNISYDSDRLFDSVPFVNNMTVQNNLFYGARKFGVVLYGEGNGRCIDKETREYVSPCPFTDIKFRNNVIYGNVPWISTNKGPRDSEFSCNVALGSGHAAGVPGPGSRAFKNSFYGTSGNRFSGSGDVTGSVSDAKHANLCVNIRPFTDEGEKCFAHGQPTAESNHACDDIGVRMSR